MLSIKSELELAKIESEQSKYKMSMTCEELCERQKKHYEQLGITPPTLDEINQYISEVRNGAK